MWGTLYLLWLFWNVHLNVSVHCLKSFIGSSELSRQSLPWYSGLYAWMSSHSIITMLRSPLILTTDFCFSSTVSFNFPLTYPVPLKISWRTRLQVPSQTLHAHAQERSAVPLPGAHRFPSPPCSSHPRSALPSPVSPSIPLHPEAPSTHLGP